jgi:hypothetical protein
MAVEDDGKLRGICVPCGTSGDAGCLCRVLRKGTISPGRTSGGWVGGLAIQKPISPSCSPPDLVAPEVIPPRIAHYHRPKCEFLEGSGRYNADSGSASFGCFARRWRLEAPVVLSGPIPIRAQSASAVRLEWAKHL